MPASSLPDRTAAIPAPPDPDIGVPKPDERPPNAVDDRALMTVGVLGFGTVIPLATGLYGPIGPRSPTFWAGCAAFLALSASIWLGNRWLLLEQRRHFDWISDPWRKLTGLVTAVVLYTAPLTAGSLWLWYRLAGLPVDAGAIQSVTLINVICVIFVTHGYETVFLIRERASDLTRVERLERTRAQAELEGLRAQIDPHFLFNSLNALGHVISHDPRAAREFCDALAEVYRYVLASRQRDLVPLTDELAFAAAYHRLLALRFGRGVQLVVDPALLGLDRLVPPLALQTLLENAVKHNQVGEAEPLIVEIAPAAAGVRVGNALRPRSSAWPTASMGLRTLDERCRLLAGRALEITRAGGRFEVTVPWSDR